MAADGSTMMTVRFDAATYEQAQALARADFPKPSGEGNVTAMLRHLIRMAYANPERFNLTASTAAPEGPAGPP